MKGNRIFAPSARLPRKTPWATFDVKRRGEIVRYSRFVSAGVAIIAASSLAVAVAASSSAAGTVKAKTASAAAGVAAAKAQLNEFTGIPKFTLHAAKFDMAKVKGKLIFDIPSTSAVPYIVDVDMAAKKLFQSYGAKWVEYTNQGSPTQWTAGINEAIADHAAAIILDDGVTPSLIVPALKKANAAHIPMIVTHDYQIGQQANPKTGGLKPSIAKMITAYVSPNFWLAAKLEADYVIAKSNGTAHVLIVSTSDVPPTAGILPAMEGQYKKYCPGCTVKVLAVPLANWATQIPSGVQSAINADPKLSWVTAMYDSEALYIEQGITAAGKSTTVHMDGYNGTPSVMKLIESGHMAMDVGEDIDWLAYATVDQVARAVTGAPIVPNGDEQLAMRVFTTSNIAQDGTPPTGDTGYGSAYISGYKALWSGK